MPTGTINSTAQVGGISMNGIVSRDTDGQIGHEIILPAGEAGTLSTRTDDDTGEATLAADHEITDGDVVDVYWSGGVAYGATVGTVAGTTVPLDLASGDAFPAEDTAIVVTKQVTIDTDFDGDNVEIIAVHCTRRGHVDFQDAGGASLDARELSAGEVWSWVDGSGVSNPLAGNPVDAIKASCGDSVNAGTLKIGVLYDSVA